MKKILDSHWLRGVQFYGNTVSKKKIAAAPKTNISV